MRRITFAVVALSLLATGVSAQSLQDRIDRVRKAQQREQVDRVVRQRIARARIEQKLGYVVKDVNVDKATLRQTFKW